MTPKHVGAIQACICTYKKTFVGVMNEQLNSVKMHGTSNVKTVEVNLDFFFFGKLYEVKRIE